LQQPFVLFKIVLIQHLYGIPSLRRTMQEINMNIAYRWFLGYTLNEELPHFSTVSYNFKHRFTEETVEQVFSWILQEANYAGYLEPEAVFVDGTHIKANANINKKIKKAVPQAAKRYASELMEEVNADREDHGKKPFDSTPKPPKEKEIMVSKTDPESGLFQKGEHKKCFAYESKSCTKTVTRHVWQDYVELAEDIRHTPKYKELYKKRKETILFLTLVNPKSQLLKRVDC
jgi:hypothetical protein